MSVCSQRPWRAPASSGTSLSSVAPMAHSAGATARCTCPAAGKPPSMRADTRVRAKCPPRWLGGTSFLFRITQSCVLSIVTGWACSEFWAICQARLTVAYPNPLGWCPFGWPSLSQACGARCVCPYCCARLHQAGSSQVAAVTVGVSSKKRGLVSRGPVSTVLVSNGLASKFGLKRLGREGPCFKRPGLEQRGLGDVVPGRAAPEPPAALEARARALRGPTLRHRTLRSRVLKLAS